jgi:hypothetical protein
MDIVAINLYVKKNTKRYDKILHEKDFVKGQCYIKVALQYTITVLLYI